MDSVEHKGRWWLAEHPDDKVGGKLTYSAGSSPHLELYGEFENDLYFYGSNRTRILGVSSQRGQPITLEGPRKAGSSNAFSGAGSVRFQNYSAEKALIGSQYPNLYRNISFDEIRISFSILNDWLEYIPPATDNTRTRKAGDPIEVSVDIPDEILVSGMKFDFRLRAKEGSSLSRHGRGSIDVNPEIILTPTAPNLCISECMAHVRTISNLISFATNTSIRPSYIRLRSKTPTPNSSSLYLDMLGDDKESQHPNRMLFQPGDCPGGITQMVHDWCKITTSLRPVIDLYSAVTYSTDMNIEPRFLSLMQCVEGYYVRERDNRYVSEYKWEEVRSDFKEIISGDVSTAYNNNGMVRGSVNSSDLSKLKSMNEAYNLGNSLVSKMKPVIKYANEHSLRKKLRELVREQETLIEDLPHNIVGKTNIAVDTRNHHVHQTTDAGSHIAEGKNLLAITWGVQQLLDTLLLVDMGIDDGQIKNRLATKYKRTFA